MLGLDLPFRLSRQTEGYRGGLVIYGVRSCTYSTLLALLGPHNL